MANCSESSLAFPATKIQRLNCECRVALGLHLFALANELVIIVISVLYLIAMQLARAHDYDASDWRANVALTCASIVLTIIGMTLNIIGVGRLRKMASTTWTRVKPVVQRSMTRARASNMLCSSAVVCRLVIVHAALRLCSNSAMRSTHMQHQDVLDRCRAAHSERATAACHRHQPSQRPSPSSIQQRPAERTQ